MANENIYPNYLMHYRTKGSKNGVSTTPGYVAVGKKAGSGLTYNSDGSVSYGGKNWVNVRDKEAAQNKEDGTTTTVRVKSRELSGNLKSGYNSTSSKPLTSYQKGMLNNWQQQGNTFRAANEAHERFGSGKSKNITGTDQKSNYGGFGTHASLEGSTRAMNAVANLGKLRREKKNLSLYGSGDTKTRNSRSDIANAFADAKADAKNAFKTMKKKAALSIFNKFSTGIRKDKRKKKSLKDLFK